MNDVKQLEAKKKILNAWDTYLDKKFFLKNVSNEFVYKVKVKLSYNDNIIDLENNQKINRMTHYWESDGNFWVPDYLYYQLSNRLGKKIDILSDFDLAVALVLFNFLELNPNFSLIHLLFLLSEKYSKSCRLIIPLII